MIKDIVNSWVNDKKRLLVKSYESKVFGASGNWENDLETLVKVSPTRIRVVFLGSYYTQWLIPPGRSPNKDQSHVALAAFAVWAGNTWMKDWVNRSGLNVDPIGAAYNLGKKGKPVPNAMNQGGLITDVINRDSIKQLAKDIGDFYIEQFKTDLRRLKI